MCCMCTINQSQCSLVTIYILMLVINFLSMIFANNFEAMEYTGISVVVIISFTINVIDFLLTLLWIVIQLAIKIWPNSQTWLFVNKKYFISLYVTICTNMLNLSFGTIFLGNHTKFKEDEAAKNLFFSHVVILFISFELVKFVLKLYFSVIYSYFQYIQKKIFLNRQYFLIYLLNIN